MVSRRLLSLFSALILPAVACSPAQPPAPGAQSSGAPAPAATSAPAVAQKFRYATTVIPANLDPGTSVIGTARKFDIFETLVGPDVTGKVTPQLASEWKSVDATTWRITVRPDSKFHDGTPVTANDVVYTWKRAAKPELKSPIPGYLSSVDTMTAVDTKTVEVKTKVADPIFPRRLFYFGIVPQAYVEKVGDVDFGQKPMGSGPFKFVSIKPDDQVVLSGWAEHPYRKPTLTELTIKLVPDTAVRLAGLKSGELDFIQSPPLDAVAGLQRDGFQSWTNTPGAFGLLLDTLGTNGTDAGPIADSKVRQALNYAVDREAIAKGLWQGLAKPAGTMVIEGNFGYSADIKPYTYDLAKAKALLASSGYPNGFKMTIAAAPNLPEFKASAIAIQDQLKALNIEADVELIEAAAIGDRFFKVKPTLALIAVGITTTPLYDADIALSYFWSQAGTGKRFNNAEFDAKYEASRREIDPAKRETLLKEAATILQNDPPFLPVTTIPVVTAWNKDFSVPAVLGESSIPYFETIKKLR